MGGEIKVESQAGAFTRFKLTLPLAGAITQGLLFKIGGQVYAVPAAHVIRLVASLCRTGSDPWGSLLSVSAHHLHGFLLSQAFPGAMAPPRRTTPAHDPGAPPPRARVRWHGATRALGPEIPPSIRLCIAVVEGWRFLTRGTCHTTLQGHASFDRVPCRHARGVDGVLRARAYAWGDKTHGAYRLCTGRQWYEPHGGRHRRLCTARQVRGDPTASGRAHAGLHIRWRQTRSDGMPPILRQCVHGFG